MRARALAALLCLLALSGAAEPWAIHAQRAHLGDGSVLGDAVVVLDGDRIVSVGSSASVHPPKGATLREVADLVPGLVAASVLFREPPDAPSVHPQRLAVDLADEEDVELWLERGVTGLVVLPGTRRLAPGWIGVMRLDGDGADVHVARSAASAVLDPSAYAPPFIYEPILRPSADNPQSTAQPQRPQGAMGAMAELRGLLLEARHEQAAAWHPLLERDGPPLRVRAESEADIGRALDLAREFSLRLVVEGGTEAWKRSEDLARAGALVVLESEAPGLLQAPSSDLEAQPDAAALLTRAGVPVALSAQRWDDRDPLALAAAATRLGLDRELAIAAVTGIAAKAGGATDVGVIRRGARADLVGFDGDPLDAPAPAFVVAAGRMLPPREDPPRAAPPEDDPLVVRAGRLLSANRSVDEPAIVMRGERIVSVTPGSALPREARVLDFGAGAVVVPGFIDAWSRAGLDPGPPAGGSPRVRAQDAVEPGHESLARALEAGVTLAVSAPATRGPVLGRVAVIGTSSPERTPRRDADRPEIDLPADARPLVDVLAGDAGIAFWLDDGPDDDAPAASRLKALKDVLSKAKAYHDKWVKAEKKPEAGKKGKKPAQPPEDEEKPEKDDALEPFRPLFAGKTRAWLRAGREESMLPGLDALKAVGVTPVLVGAEEADLVASSLAERGIFVVLGADPLRRVDGRLVNTAERLRAAGVPVALGSEVPATADGLPLAAARLVRLGLSHDDALLALTVTAAQTCGLEGSVGRVEPGFRADLVVFDGDPFEASSRVLAVVARGRVAFLREGAAR